MCAPLFLSKNQTNILTNIEKNVAYYSCFMNNRPIVYRYTILEVLMNIFKSIKKQLKFCIKAMDSSSSLFVVNPEKDFTRKRKHLFGDILMNVILLESGSLKDELFKRFGYSLDTPSASSFIQARDKIRPDAFHTLFDMFNSRTHKTILHFVKVQKANQKFLIRVKDIDSKTSVLRSFGPFEDKEFDVHVKRILTTRQTNEIKAHPEIYKFIPKIRGLNILKKDTFLNLAFESYDSRSAMIHMKVSLRIWMRMNFH